MAKGKTVQRTIIKENNKTISDISSKNVYEELMVTSDGRLVPESQLSDQGVKV